jgi:putative phosphoribosyl transferase
MMGAFSSTACPFVAVRELTVPFARDRFSVEIASPREAVGVVLLARDNGNAVRRRSLSASLRGLGFATATCQLLTPLECRSPLTIKRMAADVPLLTARLAVMVAAVSREPDLRGLPVGILASGTVAAAALTFASRHPREVGAIVSREGRVDLAPDPETVRCPTLLIAGGVDPAAIRISQQVFQRLSCTKGIDVIAGATHGFHDSGAFELASRLACDWFLTHISAGVGS